ncbi:DinB family protein [Eisenibacter elegans]|uniref:DinB family protein n=1 Tax=Eisenibacter elegans TaxID=997 RepID=UPI00040260F6|nr:DinB family protein [Eisenibacter elegans]
MQVSEMRAQTQALVERYIQDLDRYTDEQFAYKSADKVWSLGQMYEHLIQSSKFFVIQLKSCLEQKNGSTEGERNEHGDKAFQYNSFPPIKIEVPEAWRGPDPEAKDRAYYRTALQSTLDYVSKLEERVAQNDGQYKTRHVFWGMLTAQDWYQIIGMHLKHHNRQQTELEQLAGVR